jgi:hypothetical protein
MTYIKLLILVSWLMAGWSLQAQDEIGDLLGRINTLRASKGLPPYTMNGSLVSAAQSQAQWLIANNCTIAHTHPDGSNPRSRAQATGYATADVSENIYCGGNASTSSAWLFWVNSAIHYAGLVNTRYKEIGIAAAHGSYASYVLVFGNPGGPDFAPAGGGSNAQGNNQQPSYVKGLDEHGNIKHEIQDGDTLGQIALIYGYTWADIPGILALNGLTEADYRVLEVGAIILVPPKAGTYTPTPANETTPAPPASTGEHTSTIITSTLTSSPTETETPLVPEVATAVPEVMIVLLPTTSLTKAAAMTTPSDAIQTSGQQANTTTILPNLLVAALLVQVVVVLLAGRQFLHRTRQRAPRRDHDG